MAKKHGQSEEWVYSEEQLRKLWNQCKEPVDKVVVGLAAFMGLRVGEIVHLKSNWVRDEEIHIPSRMPCNCWECADKGYWKPKSKAGIRVTSIPAFLKPILADYLSKFPDGLRITRQAAWYRVQRLAENAELPHIFPHALRATAATTLASKGFTAVELCAYFGWERLNVGEHYIRISEAKIGTSRKIKEIYG